MIALIVAVALAAICTGLVRRFALSRSFLDIPNHRSSHSAPTPRGGGLAIAIVLELLLAGGAVEGWLSLRLFAALAGGTLAVAWVGWRDDRRNVPPLRRALVHFVAAIWATACLGGLTTLRLGSTMVSLGMFGSALAVLGIVWLINLYNFMDGIDGLAGSNATLVGLFGAWITMGSDRSLTFASIAVAGCSFGFLLWNWPPARIFLGDVGSGLLGYYFAVLALASEARGSAPLSLWLVLMSVFVVDATITLARRALKGERWYEAHRSHAYQRIVQAGYSHRVVTSVVVATDVVLGLAAVATMARPLLQPLLLLAAISGVLLLYVVVERIIPMDAIAPGSP